jgi:vacuolar-type H+-ATPase subunit H
MLVIQAAQNKQNLDAARNRNVELTEQIEEYMQKLKDVIELCADTMIFSVNIMASPFSY